MDYQYLNVENRSGYKIVKFARQNVANALNIASMEEFMDLLRVVEKDNSTQAIIITGEGDKYFCSGVDLKERASREEEAREYAVRLFKELLHYPKILIAAVNGYAYGGGFELAMVCDVIYCSTNAKFALPEVKLGVIPGGMGTQILPKMIGIHRAKELILSGKQLSSLEALNLGITSKVSSPDQLVTEAAELAEQISKNAPIGLKFAKQMVNLSFNLDLESGRKLESQHLNYCLKTTDRKEALDAFMNKRKPVFVGK